MCVKLIEKKDWKEVYLCVEVFFSGWQYQVVFVNCYLDFLNVLHELRILVRRNKSWFFFFFLKKETKLSFRQKG